MNTAGRSASSTPRQRAAPFHFGTAARGGVTAYTLALGIAAICLVFPLFAATYLPLVDYPNHLARSYILAHWEAVPAFRATYVPVLEPIPNVGIDVLLVLFQRFLPVVEAGRLFLAISALTFLAGCHWLGRAVTGRDPWMALPAAALFYSSPLMYGFVNYMLGVALFLVAFAAWIQWRERWTVGRLLTVSLLVLAAYFVHLTGYAFLWLAMVAVTVFYLTRRSLRFGPAVVGLLPLVPPALAFLAFMGGSGRTGEISWNTPVGKAIGVFGVIRTYNLKLDLVFALLFGGACLTLLFLARGAKWDSRLLVPAGVLFLVFLAAPAVLLTSSGADLRFVVPAAALLLLAIPVAPLRGARGAAFGVLCGVMILRLVVITGAWRESSARAEVAVRLLDRLPVGASVYPVFEGPAGADADKRVRGLEHFVQYAVIRRHAYVPTLFALRGQQPLVFRNSPPPRIPDSRLGFSAVAEQGYQYLWSFGRAFPARGAATPVGEAAGFTLYKVGARGLP